MALVIFVDSWTTHGGATVSGPTITIDNHPNAGEGAAWASGTERDPILFVLGTSSDFNTTVGNAGPHNLSALRGSPIGTGAPAGFSGAITENEEAVPPYNQSQLNYLSPSSWSGDGSPSNCFLIGLTLSGANQINDKAFNIKLYATEIDDPQGTYTAFTSSPPNTPGGEPTFAWDSEAGGVYLKDLGNQNAGTQLKLGTYEDVGGGGVQAQLLIPDIIHVHPDNDASCNRAAMWQIELVATNAIGATTSVFFRLQMVHSDS